MIQEASHWQITSAMRTDVGRIRSNNEDTVAADPDKGIFIVCDGMGGAAAGEVASRRAAEDSLAALQSDPLNLERAIQLANSNVLSIARQNPGRSGMGTTLVALVISGDQARVGHVGDSRCYRLRAGVLEQITEDHSFVAEQVRRGLLTADEAARSSMRNVITRAVGTSEHVQVDTVEWPIVEGDIYLLATDGLTREVPDPEIANVLSTSGDPARSCEMLISAANSAGGRDNISCIVVRVADR